MGLATIAHRIWAVIGSCLCGYMDYGIGSNFWKFYLIKTSFILDELVSLVKVFRLFRLAWIVLMFRLWTQEIDVQHLIYWQGQCVCDALFCVE
jgi:uncharacterized protein YybS (DUF2232 family)